MSAPSALADRVRAYLEFRGNPAPDAPLLASHGPAGKGDGGLSDSTTRPGLTGPTPAPRARQRPAVEATSPRRLYLDGS